MEIRMATPADAAQIQAVYAPYCSTPITFELVPPTVEEMQARLAAVLKHHPWLVMVENNKIIGYAYGHTFKERAAYRWAVETSVYVAQEHRSKGVGKALYTRLLAMLKQQGFITCIGGITLPNPASEQLHAQFGFQRIGVYKNIGYKCDRWLDVAFYELELNPPVLSPAEPLPAMALADRL